MTYVSQVKKELKPLSLELLNRIVFHTSSLIFIFTALVYFDGRTTSKKFSFVLHCKVFRINTVHERPVYIFFDLWL